MSASFLTTEEIVELTHRKYPAWQARELEHMRIAFRRRTDGSLVVLRGDLEPKQDAKPRPQLRAG